MYTAMVIMLIVIFGAALMGKMLKDMFPGALFGASKTTAADDAPTAD